MMINLDEIQHLQGAYGSDWIVRVTNGQPRATRRRTLSDEELSAGMAMTLFDGDGAALGELLIKQERIEADLIKAALKA